MARTVLSLLFVAGLSAAAPVKPRGAGDVPSELEGKWVVTEAITLGGINQSHLADAVFVIAGDRFTYATPAKAESRGRIKVEDKASPKRFEFAPETPDGRPANDKPGRWIYELDGGELQMASFTDADGAIPDKIDPTDRKQMIWKAKRIRD
jgi:uncharacterized protein (TIGR03067 family)